jgi:hypothetical protein
VAPGLPPGLSLRERPGEQTLLATDRHGIGQADG